jgi:hypothetical protein
VCVPCEVRADAEERVWARRSSKAINWITAWFALTKKRQNKEAVE